MGDFYTEQLVKKQATAQDAIKKILLIVVTVLSFGVVVLFPMAIIVPVVLIVLDFFMWKNMDLEFEYLYVNGELTIDKIFAKQRRKKAYEVNVNDVELVAPTGAHELVPYKDMRAMNFASRRADSRTYEMVVLKGGVKEKIIFEPNDTIIEGMKMLAPRKVVR